VLTQNILSSRGRTIRPKTLNQKRYVDAIDKHTIVFGIGPAGTGKTYLAMAKAVQALQAKEVNRIILTRPAVEAGERLGFLPGTLYEKIDPYLRPLYDALHDMIDPDSIPKLMAAGTIEIAPLAFMRGRTLNDASSSSTRRRTPRRADEDVPHPARLRLQDRGDRRRHPGRPARRQVSGLRVVQDILDGHRGHPLRPADQHRRGPAPAGREIVDAYGRYDARANQRRQRRRAGPAKRGMMRG
jgi:phosphate starvation-inducible PhoH-like protein